MARRLRSLLLSLLAAAPIVGSFAGQAQAEGTDAALAADDECRSGASPECAISALQMKRQQLQRVREASEAATTPLPDKLDWSMFDDDDDEDDTDDDSDAQEVTDKLKQRSAAGAAGQESQATADQLENTLAWKGHSHPKAASNDDDDDDKETASSSKPSADADDADDVEKPSAPTSSSNGNGTESAEGINGANLTKPGPTEPPKPKFAKAFATCAGDRYTGPTECEEGYKCAHLSPYYGQCKPASEVVWAKWKPAQSALSQPSDAPLKTFYMYRAQGTTKYPPANANTGTLGGVMWYIHNEVVSCIYSDCMWARRYGIDRIVRYKVQTKAPEPLWKAGMNFGIRYAYDSGQCTGPWVCTDQFDKYGYFVGCNNLSTGFPFPNWPVYYSGAWYSLPGSCSEMKYKGQTLDCKQDQPGGLCQGTPTGAGNCTYSFEEAGEVLLDDIEGITNYTGFKFSGGEEFNKSTDEGVNMTFWDGINNTKKNAERVAFVDNLFKQKYPHFDSDAELPPPQCDFDMEKFFPDGTTTLKLNPNAHPR